MNNATKDNLIQLASAGLKTCLLKINTVTPGTWRLEGLEVRGGRIADAVPAAGAGVIRITVRSSPPMITLLVFGEADAGLLYECFVSDSLREALGPGRQEATLLEIGNVLLNALANSLLKAFRKSAIPSVPERVSADPAAITAPPAEPRPPEAALTIVSARLSLQRDGRRADAELLALVPDGLAPELQP